MQEFIPSGATWERDSLQTVDPSKNIVNLASGKQISYDYLVVATGIECNFEKIKGVKENLGKNGVCSIYAFDQCEGVFENAQALKGGRAIFTQVFFAGGEARQRTALKTE